MLCRLRNFLHYCYYQILLPATLRAAQTCRYLVYSEADFEVFHPAGATRCTDGVKFGMEEGTFGKQGGEGREVECLHAKFHLNVFIVSASGDQKPQFWANFDTFGRSCIDPLLPMRAKFGML